MHYSHYIGVDISKNTLDAAFYAADMRRSDTKHLTNDKAGLKELITWAKAAGVKPKDMLICTEHTGVYGNELNCSVRRRASPSAWKAPYRSSDPWDWSARPEAGRPYERNKYPQTTPLNRRKNFFFIFFKKTCKSLRILDGTLPILTTVVGQVAVGIVKKVYGD